MWSMFFPTKASAARALAEGQKTGDFAPAIRQYRRLVKHSPNHHEFFNNLGYALLESGKPEEAVPLLREAVRLSDCCTNWNNLGRALISSRDWGEAKAALERARVLDPGDPKPWFNQGMWHLEQGEKKQAAEVWSGLLRTHPHHAGALTNLALCHEEDGRRVQAYELLRTATQVAPEYLAANANLIRLLCEEGRHPEAMPYLQNLSLHGTVRVLTESDEVQILLNDRLLLRVPMRESVDKGGVDYQ